MNQKLSPFCGRMVIKSSLILKAIVNKKILRDQVDIALVSRIKKEERLRALVSIDLGSNEYFLTV